MEARSATTLAAAAAAGSQCDLNDEDSSLDGATAVNTPVRASRTSQLDLSYASSEEITKAQETKAAELPVQDADQLYPNEPAVVDDTASSTSNNNEEEAIFVTFKHPKDPDNPYDWSRWRKIRIAVLVLSYALMTGLSIGLYAAQSDIFQELLNVSALSLRFGISVFVWAVGFAPLVQAPFSEIYGRRWFYPVTGFIYSMTFFAQIWPQNLATLLVCRTIAGLAGAVGNTLVAGTLADIYEARTRGWIMACFSLSIFLVIAISVWLGDVIVLNLGWRWIGWIQLIISLSLTISYIPLLPETRGNTILYHKKLKLEKTTGKKHRALGEEERQQKWTALIRTSLVRPAYMLAFEPVVQAFSLWLGFLWGLVFLLLESVPVVFAQYSSFSKSQQSLAFVSLFIGALIGFVATQHQEHLYKRDVHLARAKGARVAPESRLYHAMVGGVMLPIGMLIFAWTGRPGIPWIAPCIGLAVVGAAAFPPYMTVFSYLADVYETYASSALACQSLCRNIGVGSFVLFAVPMYEHFPRPAGSPQSTSYALASTTLAAIAAILGLVPFLLFKWGEPLRKRSKMASKIDRTLNEKFTLGLESSEAQMGKV